MQRKRGLRRKGGIAVALVGGMAIAASGAVVGAGAVAAGAATPAASPHALQTVASGLNSPRHLSVGPDGALYVAEAGTGGPSSGVGRNCVATENEAQIPTSNCFGTTGSIARVTTSGAVSTVLSGLPSVVTEPAGPIPAEYAGPSAVAFTGGQLNVTTQAVSLNPDGTNQFGPAGTTLGSLLSAVPNSAASSWSVTANLAAYAAANPQSAASLGTNPSESATDSDPYDVIPYNGGYAVVDAAANSLRWVSPSGAISTLAAFPTQTGGVIQAVPTSVVVGPDGALYVGELNGAGAAVGSSVVYRLVPGHTPTVFASGFTTITDLAFNRSGQLLVLEYDTNGLTDQTGASGAVIQVASNGTQTTLASTGLIQPTGLAVGTDGSIYVSNNGDVAGQGSIVRIPVTSQTGYQEVAADGGSFNFGTYPFLGSLGGITLNKPIVGATSTRTMPGYWSVASDGGVFAFGAAGFYGSLGGKVLNAPVVGITPTPDGRGYWLVASDGGVFSFGDAAYYGSMGGKALNKPIVGIQATPDGGGYWLVASDGGVFSFGDAAYYGSMGGKALNKPIVGIESTPDGAGYWLVASDGGIFTFGDAGFLGSTGGKPLNKPVVGIQATPDGAGYWLVASDGGIFTFGDAGFFGSMGSTVLNKPVVGLG